MPPDPDPVTKQLISRANGSYICIRTRRTRKPTMPGFRHGFQNEVTIKDCGWGATAKRNPMVQTSEADFTLQTRAEVLSLLLRAFDGGLFRGKSVLHRFAP